MTKRSGIKQRNDDSTFAAVLTVTLQADPSGGGQSPIDEPFPQVANGGLTGAAVAESPDPLVAYRWPDPKASDGLQIYQKKPEKAATDTPDSFENLQFLTTSKPDVTVKGAGSIRMDFGRESAAWLEFDSPDLTGEVEMSVSEYNRPMITQHGGATSVKTLKPVRYGNTCRLELNKLLYEGVRFGWIHVRSRVVQRLHAPFVRGCAQYGVFE